MVYLFVIKMIFQSGLCSSKDQDSSQWPLLPDGVSNGCKKPRAKTITEDNKSDCFRLTQCEDLTLTEGWRNSVVGTIE